MPLDQWADEWLAAYVGRASSTQARARSALRAHILPRFAECRGVRAPRAASRHQPRCLTPGELERLAAHVRPPYDLLVRFTAYTGLRWGEVAALRVADVDLLRGAVTVARSLERRGTVKDTKTHSRRVVHLEKALRDEVAAHIQSHALSSADHIWTRAGWSAELHELPATRVAAGGGGIRARPFAALSRSEAHLRVMAHRPGGTARAVMAWMGHSTIKVTFDRYGHLFPHELEDLAAHLSDLRQSPEQWDRRGAMVAEVVPIVKTS